MRRHLVALLLAGPAVAAPPLVIEADASLDIRSTTGVRRVRSLSTDGRCLVRLDLDPAADRATVRAAVADRLAGRLGVRLRPDADDAVIAVAVRSDGRADIVALTAVAERVRPRLTAVPQVADVVPVGTAEVGPRVVIDADKLAAFNLTGSDLLAALRPARTPDDLGNVVIKAAADQPVRLRDVAVVEKVVRRTSTAGVTRPGSEPTSAVLLLVRPAVGAVAAVNAAVGKLLDGAGRDLAPGVTLERLAFGTGDTAATLRLPAGTEASQRDRLARDAAATAARSAGVRSVAWVAGLADDTVTLLVAGPAPDPGSALPGVAVRVGRMRWPLDDWPGEGAAIVARVSGDNADAVTAAAGELRERLASIAGVADLAAEPGERVRTAVHIDRAMAAKLGVTVEAINETVALATTGVRLGSVVVTVSRGADDLRAVRIPNGQGQLVPLGTVVEVRQEHGPVAVYREDGRPCRVVTCGVRGRDTAAVRADVRAMAHQLTAAGVTILVE